MHKRDELKLCRQCILCAGFCNFSMTVCNVHNFLNEKRKRSKLKEALPS